MDSFDDEIESVIYMCREVSVYKIPPLKANEGHRAGEWGDLASPLWKGRLRIIEKSSGVFLLFEDETTGELFVRATYDPEKPCIEAVLDSSRYFVIRVEEADRKAFIGMGFVERTDSFDFNVSLQDYTKRYRKSKEPASSASEPVQASVPKKDYSLKEGQTFSISLPGRKKNADTTNLLGAPTTASSGDSGTPGSPPLLPPPLPPPPSTNKRRSGQVL